MKVHDVLVFTLLLVIGVASALHLNEVSLPHWFAELIHRVQTTRLEGEPVAGPEVTVKSGPSMPRYVDTGIEAASPKPSVTTARVKEAAPQYVCRKKSSQAIEEVSGPEIYKWVDEKGKTHFGDRRPEHSSVQTVAVDGRKHYFNLTLHTDGKTFPPYFRDRLTARVNKAYDVLAKLLSEQQLHQVDVNLWVFGSRPAYDSFYTRHASGIASKSQGFHNSQNNIAAALYKNDKQVLSTGVHEAVHVMNAGMFGRLPRWLNEGMAEYLENISVYGQSADILIREDWLRQMQKTRLNTGYLLVADWEQWQGRNSSSLYAHSWALVYFLMSTQEGRDVIRRYLIASAAAPCHSQNARAYFQRYYSGGMGGLEHNFEAWLSSDKLPHHI